MPRNRRTRARGLVGFGAGAAAIFAVAAWTACGLYGPGDLLPAPAPIVDASIRDSAPIVPPLPDAGHLDADTCAHARWPARPAADDPTTTPNVVSVSALATIDLGLSSEAGPPPLFGFDLDHVCTCPGPDSCINSFSTAPHCDEDGGRDNASVTLLGLVATYPGFDQSSLNSSLQDGKYGLVVVLSNWNGQPNDTQVSTSVFVSNGLTPVGDAGTVGPAKGDGTDVWTISTDSLLGGASLAGIDCGDGNTQCAPVYNDDNAYVAGGVLVGSIDFTISLGNLGSGTVNVDLNGGVVTAQLVQTTGGWGLQNGVIAGRWPTSELLSSLSALPDPLTKGSYLCGADLTYGFIKSQICQAMDIVANENLDQTGAPCDAISLSLGFTASPAQMGLATEKSAPFAGCTSDAGVPFHDQCQ